MTFRRRRRCRHVESARVPHAKSVPRRRHEEQEKVTGSSCREARRPRQSFTPKRYWRYVDAECRTGMPHIEGLMDTALTPPPSSSAGATPRQHTASSRAIRLRQTALTARPVAPAAECRPPVATMPLVAHAAGAMPRRGALSCCSALLPFSLGLSCHASVAPMPDKCLSRWFLRATDGTAKRACRSPKYDVQCLSWMAMLNRQRVFGTRRQ